jgi:hypothetical protein
MVPDGLLCLMNRTHQSTNGISILEGLGPYSDSMTSTAPATGRPTIPTSSGHYTKLGPDRKIQLVHRRKTTFFTIKVKKCCDWTTFNLVMVSRSLSVTQKVPFPSHRKNIRRDERMKFGCLSLFYSADIYLTIDFAETIS